MSNDKRESSFNENLNELFNPPNKNNNKDSAYKYAIKSLMVNLPGRNMYTYGKNVKKIFEELKKT